MFEITLSVLCVEGIFNLQLCFDLKPNDQKHYLEKALQELTSSSSWNPHRWIPVTCHK